jgi:hypothetical protein
MTESSKDEALSRAYRRNREVDEELRLLALEARRVGKIFSEIGTALASAPQNMVLEKEYFSSPFQADYMLKQADQKDVNTDKLRALTNDFRKLLAEKTELEKILEH